MKIRNRAEPANTQLSMTSMIDIVFLLLIFFILTFKIAEVEGDFSVRMPLAGSDSVSMDPADLPLKLRMRADDRGRLTSIALNEIDLGQDFDQLRANIVSLIGTTTPAVAGEGPELEIDTDYNLRYEYVIRAITAVSGYKDGNQVVKLIEKIKFAKPRRSP